MAEHGIATQEKWQAEREELVREKKELTGRGDELTRKRRELPWVAVEKDYRFETGQGTKTLAALFDGRSQLMVYHFMFGPPYTAGCPVCSSIADTLAPQVPHLKGRGTTRVLGGGGRAVRWQFVSAQGLFVGIGSSATFAPVIADTSLWFTRRRGMAVAIIASG